MKRIKTVRRYEISDEQLKTQLGLAQNEVIDALVARETPDNPHLKKWFIVTTQKE